MSVTLTKIPNPLQPEIRIIETLDYIEGQRLNYYLNDLPLHDTEITFVIAINGEIVSGPYTEISINDNDIISVCAKTEVTVAAYVASYVAGALVGTAFSTAITYSLIYAATFLATMFVISYGMNALMSALSPDTQTNPSDYSEQEQTYGWGDLRQTRTEGSSIPYYFGTNKVSGHILNQFLTISGNKETINILMGLCAHQVDSITDVRINDQPYTYYKNIEVFADRVGTLNDAPIDGFSELVGQNDVGSKLSYNTPVTQQTDGNAVEKLIIFVTAPSGFYYTNNQGGLDARTATFDVEYRIVGAPSYTLHSQETFGGATTEAQRMSITIDDTTPDQYEIKLTRTNGEETSFKGNSDIYFTSVQEIIKKELIYPGLAKYAIKALATDQLSGSMPALSCLVERSTVRVFDYDLQTPAWADKRATNPAWICYSLLVTYAGLDKDRVIWDDFSAWADYCDEDVDGAFRFIVNTTINSSNFWDQVQRVAKLGHAAIIRRGVRYGTFVDKQDTVMSHLFTMGNIVKGSFNLQFLAKKDRANAVAIEYTDPARDYTRQVVTIHTNDFLTTSEVALPARVSIQASISQAQAIREGVFAINSNVYMNRIITFDAFVDSFACTIGDLFYFQHENVNYQGSNTGGMIKTAGNDDGFGNPYVQVDVPIDIEVSVSYRIMVRLINTSGIEEFVEKIVNNTPGSTDILTLTTSWETVPDDFAVFLFGTATTYKKPYRITSIDRKDDFKRTIVGLQYIDEVYTDNSSTIIVEPPWEIHRQMAVQVLLHEFLIYQKNGQFASNIQVTWHNGYMDTGSNWAIWLENLTAETSPMKIATVHENMYTITAPLVIGSEYKIYVAVEGEGAVDTGDNTQTITMQGQLAPPASVLNFSGVWDPMRRQVHFTWTANSELDLNRYEIREGSNWATGTVIAQPTANFDSVFIDEGVSETKTYKIKAVDTSGIYSDTESSIGVAINTSDCPLTIPGDLAVSSSATPVYGGGSIVSMLAVWNGAAEVSDDWHHYDILLENTDAGSFSSFSTANRQFQWEVMPNKEYGVSVRAVDRSGNSTSWTTQVLHTTAMDETAPAIPTWPATGFAISGFKMVGLSWNDNTEYDFSHYVLERSTVSNFASDITVLGNISASFYPDSSGLEVTTTYFYRLKSVDTSGNASEYSVIKSATTGQIGGNDLAADCIIASHIQTFDLTAISAKITGILKAGKIQSDNYSTTAGVEIDLDNELVKFGGSADPKLSWNGVNLGIKGSITIEGGSGYAALTDRPLSLSDINPGEYNTIQNSIETWFDDDVPTISNEPAVNWNTTDLKNQHLGDLYYDNTSGYAYRFRVVSTTYSWLKLTDSDVTQALAAAALAQDTADGKRRVFLPGQNPTVPYDQGDLWDTGDGIKRCQTTKLSNQTYASGDWVGVADVTDYAAITAEVQAAADAAQVAAEAYALAEAELAQTTAEAHADNIVTAEEERAIADAEAKASAAQAAAELTAQTFTEAWSAQNADVTDYTAITTEITTAANAAQVAAELAASTAADLEKIRTDAYADDLVTAEEERAIADAEAKASAAQAAAELTAQTFTEAWSAQNADVTDYVAITAEAIALSNAAQVAAEAYALTKADLAQTTAEAHADNIVTAEEERAIADAQAKADAAQAAALVAAAADASAKANAAQAAAEAYAQSKLVNLISPEEDWIPGASGHQGNFTALGDVAESRVVNDIGPFGINEKIWECIPKSDDASDGGWNHANITIDPAKTYIFGCYYWKLSSDGASHFGTSTVENLGSYTVNTNPYFWSNSFPEYQKWFLIIGVVHAAGYTGGQTDLSGMYSVETGEKVQDAVDFRFQAGSTVLTHRAYHYYNPTGNGSTVHQKMARPFMIEAGKMPSINTLTEKLNTIAPNADVTDYVTITAEAAALASAAQSAAQAYALAQADLAQTTAEAHADDIVTAEEARAIADAQAKANAAQAAAETTAQAFTEAWSEENATNDTELRHASDTSMIDGGKIYAGSSIQVGNLDGVSDYVSMTPELLQYFKYFNETIGHQPSKALTRMDIGVCDNDETIPLGGYWSKAPRVFVTPDNMMVYDATASTFSQSLVCPEPIPSLISTGRYEITPQIRLEQTDGTGGGSINVSKSITKAYDGPVVIETGPEFLIPETETESMSVIVGLTGGDQVVTQNESAKHPGPYTYSYAAYLAKGRVHLQYYAGGVWNDTTWSDQWFYPTQITTIQYDISHASYITKLRMQISAYNWWVLNNRGSFAGAVNFGSPGLNYSATMSSYVSALTDNTPLAVGTVRYFAIAEE